MADTPHAYTEVTDNPQASGFVTPTGGTLTSCNFIAGRKYLIVANSQIAALQGNADSQVRIRHGGTAFDDSFQRNEGNADRYHNWTYFTVWTAVCGEAIDFQYGSPDGSTSDLGLMTLFALEISEELIECTDWYFNNGASASITFTPANANDKWLVMGTRQISSPSSTSSNTMTLDVSGGLTSSLPALDIEGEVILDDFVMTASRVYDLAASSHTFSVGGTGATTLSEAVFAINLSKFQSSGSVYTEAPIVHCGFGGIWDLDEIEAQTLAFTPATLGDTWILGYITSDGQTLNQAQGRLQVDNVDQPPTQTSDDLPSTVYSNDNRDEMGMHFSTVENLSACAHNIDFDYMSNFSATAAAEERTLIAIRLSTESLQVPPCPPTCLTACAISTTNIDICWTAPASGCAPDGYRIQRESPTGGGFSTIVCDTGNICVIYSDLCLCFTTQYNYRVFSRIACCISACPSNEACATTNTPPPSCITVNQSTFTSTQTIKSAGED